MIPASLFGILSTAALATRPFPRLPRPGPLPGRKFTAEADGWRALVSFSDINVEEEAQLMFAGPEGKFTQATVPCILRVQRYLRAGEGPEAVLTEHLVVDLLWEENTGPIGREELSHFLHENGLMDQNGTYVDTLQYGYDPEHAEDTGSRREVIVIVELIDDLDTLTETKSDSKFVKGLRHDILAHALSPVLAAHRSNSVP